MQRWPETPEELEEAQRHLAAAVVPFWDPPPGGWSAGGCFVCFQRGREGPGTSGDPGWAGAALIRADGSVAVAVAPGAARFRYVPGLLALREGPLLEAAVLALAERPDLLIVNATGRDHPRRAGLALHLGARLGLPSVGVTNRTLLAAGAPPADEDGATSPLTIGDELVGYRVRPRRGRHPLAAHAAWRTTPEAAAAIVLAFCRGRRTPEPLRLARRAAREARALEEGRVREE